MKKTLNMILAAVMVLSLCACGEKKAAETTASATTEALTASETVTTEAPVTEAPETATAAPETTAALMETADIHEESVEVTEVEEVVEIPEYLDLLVTNVGITAQAPDNSLVYTTTYPDVHFSETGAGDYEALALSLAEDSRSLKELVEESGSEFTTSLGVYKDDPYFAGFSHDILGKVIRADSRVVSIRHDYSGYRGGAHGDYSVLAYNYDAETGWPLSVSDVVTDTAALTKVLAEKLKAIPDTEYFEDSETALQNYAFDAGHNQKGKQLFSFSVGNEAMTFWFNPYELTAFAFGIQEVVLPYAEYPELFNKKYTTACENYFEPVDTYVTLPAGNQEFSLSPVYNEYGNIGGLKIAVSGKEQVFDTFTYSVDPYLVKNQGNYYLYVFESGDDDERFLDVFDLTGGTAFVKRLPLDLYVEYDVYEAAGSTEELHLSEARNTTYPLINPECFLLSGDGVSEYHVGSDGAPEK